MTNVCIVRTEVNGELFTGHGKTIEQARYNAWCAALWYFWHYTI